MIPRIPEEGAVILISGNSGSHKTNVVLSYCMDAIWDHNARIIYAAGEGKRGVGKYRLPAHALNRGKTNEFFKGKLRLLNNMPLLTLRDDVAEFIEVHKSFRPDIVVLDTVATAIAGSSVNEEKTAALLAATGSVGQIQSAFGCTVIIPCHNGRTMQDRLKGCTEMEGNAFAVLLVDHDEGTGSVVLRCHKMKDGPSGHSVEFAVRPILSGPLSGVPILERVRVIPAGDYAKKDEKKIDAAGVGAALIVLLPKGGETRTAALAKQLSESTGKKENAVMMALQRGIGTRDTPGPFYNFVVRGGPAGKQPVWSMDKVLDDRRNEQAEGKQRVKNWAAEVEEEIAAKAAADLTHTQAEDMVDSVSEERQ